MILKLTEEARDDIRKLRDRRAIAKIRKRLEYFELGNPGDVKPVGEGVSESRIHYGPGFRIYFFDHQGELIIVACVGEKSTQDNDVKRAKQIKRQYFENN